MQFDDLNSQPKLNDQTPLTDAVEARLMPFVLATPHHAPADSSHEGKNSGKLTEAQLEAITGGWNTGRAGNHNEIVVRTQEVFMPKQQREKLTATQAKPCQKQFFV